MLTKGVALGTAHILEETRTPLVQFARVGELLVFAELFAGNAHALVKLKLLLPLGMLVTLGVPLDLRDRHFDPDDLTHTGQNLLLLLCTPDR